MELTVTIVLTPKTLPDARHENEVVCVRMTENVRSNLQMSYAMWPRRSTRRRKLRCASSACTQGWAARSAATASVHRNDNPRVRLLKPPV